MKHLLLLLLTLAPLTLAAQNAEWCEDFENGIPFDFTIVDANNDGKTFAAKTYADMDGVTRKVVACTYNAKQQMDDWIFTPALRLEEGKYYEFSVDVAGWNGKQKEKFSIHWGFAPSVTGMEEVLLDVTEVQTANNNFTTYRVGFVAETSDEPIYIGIHGCSDADQFNLLLDNFAISAATTTEVPEAPALTVQPDADGNPSATLTVVCPTLTISGSSVGSLSFVELQRDGTMVKLWENPEPGATLTFLDDAGEDAYYTYTAVAQNAAGTSPKAEATRYLGINQPQPVASIKACETENDGEVRLTWPAVTRDIDGYELRPEWVAYNVVRVVNGEIQTVVAALQETEYTFQACAPQSVDIGYFGVYAQTRKGFAATSPGSQIIVLGRATDLPYTESWAGATSSQFFASALIAGSGAAWDIYKETASIPSQDGDAGYAAMNGPHYDDCAQLLLGKFRLTAKPVLHFYWLSFSETSQNTLDVVVNGTCTEGSDRIVWSQEQSGAPYAWHEAIVSLSEFAGQKVSIALQGTVHTVTYLAVDNLSLTDEDGEYVDAIHAPLENQKASSTYDLSGRRVSNPSRGVYIVDGRKVIR